MSIANVKKIQVSVLEAHLLLWRDLLAEHSVRFSPESIDAKLHLLAKDPIQNQAALLSMQTYAQLKAILFWFQDQDQEGFRQWMYVAGRFALAYPFGEGWWYHRLLPCLLSNHPGLIAHERDWPNTEPPPADVPSLWLRDSRKPRDSWHMTYAAQLALRGDWDELARACELALTDPPASYHGWKLSHYRFFLALARQDGDAMLVELSYLTSSRNLRRQADSPLFCEVIRHDALALTKLAWLHGWELDPRSPLIPSAWLPIEHCAEYRHPFPLLDTLSLN